MITSSLLPLALVILCCVARLIAVSVSVDDTDSAFIYTPATSWQDIDSLNAFDFGGGHKLTQDPSAYAEITYSYTSFSYVSALYPYQIAVVIFIDNATQPVYIDLQDYNTTSVGSGNGTVPHRVLYSSPPGEYMQHTLRITVPDDEPYCVVDQIIFEVPSNRLPPVVYRRQNTGSLSPSSSSFIPSSTTAGSLSPSSSSFTPSSTTATSNPTNDTDDNASKLEFGLKVAVIVLAVVLGLEPFGLWWYVRRRNVRHRR